MRNDIDHKECVTRRALNLDDAKRVIEKMANSTSMEIIGITYNPNDGLYIIFALKSIGYFDIPLDEPK